MQVEKPPVIQDYALNDWLYKLWEKIHEDHLFASDTWDANAIAIGAMEAKDITVTGAELGDQAIASLSTDLLDLVLDAQVTAADTVTCVLANNTAGSVNLPSATVYVRVLKRVS